MKTTFGLPNIACFPVKQLCTTITDDLITRTTEKFRKLRKKLTQALQLIERLIKEQRPSIFNEVCLTSEEIRSMSGISKRSLQTYRDKRIIPYRYSAGSFSILSQQFSRYWSVISEKPCDEIYIGSPENDCFSGLCFFLASYSMKLPERTIHIRSFVVPKSIRIRCLYNGRLNFRPKDLRMVCTANRIPDSAVIGCSYSGCCRMISKRQTLISSSVKTSPFMMRWMRRQRSYSCRNRQIFPICRFR